MSMRVLVHDYPHRTVALATNDHVLVFRHSHASEVHRNSVSSANSLSLTNTGRSNLTPRCIVEFGETSLINTEHFHTLTTARGTLGLITLNNDVFLCVVTGSEEVATVRPLETVQKIFAVEFCELIRSRSESVN